MPDKIKEAFEATKDNGIFLDEEDFRNSLSKEPKAVFELFKSDKRYGDLFLDYDDFESSLDLKKKDQQIPVGGQQFGGKSKEPLLPLTSSTVSPSVLKQPKSTTPFASTKGAGSIPIDNSLGSYPKDVKQDDGDVVEIKPINLQPPLLWQNKPASKEFEAPKPYTSEKPYIEADILTKQALEALPVYSRSVIGSGSFKREFADYLKQNPKDAQKMIAWQGDDIKSQAEQYDVLTNFYRQKAEPLVLKLEDYDKKGVGAALEKANQVYVNLDKVQDELKKNQSQVNFYLNTYLEQNGYSDIVKQAKEVKGKVNSFDAKAFDEIEKSIKQEITAVEAEIQPLIVEGSVPQENYQQYLELKSRADSLVAEYNGLIQSPEVLEYNKNVAELNELIASQNELATGLQSNSQYKKALSSYEAVSKKYTELISQAQQFDDMKPAFKDYISTASQVSDITKRYDNISKGFPAVISRNELQKKIDILGEQGDATKAKGLGVLQSLPQAANSIFSGIGSALAKMDKVMQGADDKEYYSFYDKMSDYYDNLNKFNSFVVPTPKAIGKDGSLNWSEVGYEALSQWGNMAIFASVGGYGKAPMVATAYFMSRKQREEEAEKAGLSGASKEAYVSTLSTLEGLSELIMPDNQLFTAPIKKLLLKEAIQAQAKGINWFRKRALAVVLENSGKEAVEEYVVKLGELMQKVASNYSNGNAFDISEYKKLNEWLRTGLVAAPLAGLSSSVSQRNVPKKELEVARYEAAKNLTQARVILDDFVEGNKMTTEKADAEYKKIVSYAAVQSIIPKDISNKKAVELVPLLVENERLKLQMESVDEIFKEKIKEKISANIEKAKEILNQKEEKIKVEEAPALIESPISVEGISIEDTPTGIKDADVAENIPEQVQTEDEKKVEELRAAEQAEYDAMSDPNNEAAKKEIYDRYDKLITPLLEKEGSVGVGGDVDVDLASVIKTRLREEGVSQEERNKLTGTRENPIVTSATKSDYEALLKSYKDNKQKQLADFEEGGKEEGKFIPEKGIFISSDTSFWDNKIKAVEQSLKETTKAGSGGVVDVKWWLEEGADVEKMTDAQFEERVLSNKLDDFDQQLRKSYKNRVKAEENKGKYDNEDWGKFENKGEEQKVTESLPKYIDGHYEVTISDGTKRLVKARTQTDAEQKVWNEKGFRQSGKYTVSTNKAEYVNYPSLAKAKQKSIQKGDELFSDENGKPITFYHGTDKEFSEFKPSENKYEWKGIFFAFDKDYAKWRNNKRIVEANLAVKNPLDVTMSEADWAKIPQDIKDAVKKQDIEFLKSKGYDAVILKKPLGKEIVVFDKSQIKEQSLKETTKSEAKEQSTSNKEQAETTENKGKEANKEQKNEVKEQKVEEAVSENKASEPSKSDKNYQEAQEANSIVSKENPNASVLIQPKGEDLSLTAIYVGKEKRGKGIGSKVLESVKKQANKLGKKVVLDATNELDEETDLERLGNFYEKNGFKKVGENKYEYDPKAKDSSGDIGSRADDSRTKKSDITAGTNKGESSENVSVPTKEEVVQVETNKQQEDAVQKQTAGQVPVQPEAKVGEGVEGGKPEAEAKEATEEKQEEVVDEQGTEAITEAFDALLQEEIAKKSASPTAQKSAEKKLKAADAKALKEAAKIMEHIDEIRAKLQESGIIESTTCKWG
jgi:ribosomal protein S18 acetylase RimI-like enzyme